MGEVPRGCSCSPPGPAGEGEEGAASLGWGRTHPGAASAFPRGQAQREYGTDASPSPSPRPPWRQRRREWAPATPGRKPGLWGPMTPIRSSSLESERREKSEHDRVMRIIATSINDDYRSLGGAGRRHPCGWERGDAPCTMHHAPCTIGSRLGAGHQSWNIPKYARDWPGRNSVHSYIPTTTVAISHKPRKPSPMGFETHRPVGSRGWR